MRLPAELRSRVTKRAQPEWLAPMLATLHAGEAPRGPWLFEPKLDGVRCLVFRDGPRVRLMSRNRLSLNGGFPELVQAFGRISAKRFIADGEIVAFDGRVTSFSRLQGRLGLRDPERARRTGIAVCCYVFDLLYFDTWLLTSLPLRARKEMLAAGLDVNEPIRLTPSHEGRGAARLEKACRDGLEGLIAKRADAPYTHGRSPDWLKLKCVRRQEFVIGGWTDPEGARQGFGALLVGYYEDGALRYAGKVGTGYDQGALEALSRSLARRASDRSPFAPSPGTARTRGGVHWVKPELVAEVGFTEWTRAGILRHPRFLGLRTDKRARDVVRERAADRGAVRASR